MSADHAEHVARLLNLRFCFGISAKDRIVCCTSNCSDSEHLWSLHQHELRLLRGQLMSLYNWRGNLASLLSVSAVVLGMPLSSSPPI